MDEPNAVYVSFIASSPRELWEMLTDAPSSPNWLSGNRMEVGARAGDPFRLFYPDGSIHVDGEVLACEPARRLRVRWVMPDMPIRIAEDEIEFLIEEKAPGVARMAVQEYHAEPLPPKWVVASREGWSLMLASFKTYVETGRPLPRVEMIPRD